MCPNELDFTTAVEKAKESLRKARQRHNENVSERRGKFLKRLVLTDVSLLKRFKILIVDLNMAKIYYLCYFFCFYFISKRSH